MTERKVLNKYFPPDYDPSKIPRLRRGDRRKQFNIRTMAPFNMRCNTCNGYIYKAKKFNSRMETAENVDYLGLRHYRFYIRCPLCCAEIIWRTDLESGDYVLESGAKRNFEALKTAEELEAKRQAEEEEELANNPMKLLEKRTDQSKQEMEMVEVIEDLKQLNQRQATMEADHVLLRQMWREEEALKEAEKEEDDALIKELLASKSEQVHSLPLEFGGENSSRPIKMPALKDLMKANKKEPVEIGKSYLKRQLQGVLRVQKRPVSETKIPKLDGDSEASAMNNINVSNSSTNNSLANDKSKDSNVNQQVSCTSDDNNTSTQLYQPLPGMVYSDHSDSD
ncbi:unnamed protein product [Schistosoma rodhaini]|uniref:Splicing factor YJU2 n=2 Tax=Schistosoma mansoni TaxID=6183 RepID=A0A5K4FA68_SCHMA|nr:unnamed protein product [Schistosoma rodhaini]